MNDQTILISELRRHNLMRTLLEKQIVAEAVKNESISNDELQQLRAEFLKKLGVRNEDSKIEYLQRQGLSEEDFDWQISLPLRIKKHCNSEYKRKAEAQFLARKDQLDQVVYSLLRTKDNFLSRELYLRIAAGEANFGDLSAEYSEGYEKDTKGIIGPVSLMQAHPIVAEKLRISKPGQLHQPFKVESWWLVIRLESYTPAIFDGNMAEKLSYELFQKWVTEQAERTIVSNSKYGVALDSE